MAGPSFGLFRTASFFFSQARFSPPPPSPNLCVHAVARAPSTLPSLVAARAAPPTTPRAAPGTYRPAGLASPLPRTPRAPRSACAQAIAPPASRVRPSLCLAVDASLWGAPKLPGPKPLEPKSHEPNSLEPKPTRARVARARAARARAARARAASVAWPKRPSGRSGSLPPHHTLSPPHWPVPVPASARTTRHRTTRRMGTQSPHPTLLATGLRVVVWDGCPMPMGCSPPERMPPRNTRHRRPLAPLWQLIRVPAAECVRRVWLDDRE